MLRPVVFDLSPVHCNHHHQQKSKWDFCPTMMAMTTNTIATAVPLLLVIDAGYRDRDYDYDYDNRYDMMIRYE